MTLHELIKDLREKYAGATKGQWYPNREGAAEVILDQEDDPIIIDEYVLQRGNTLHIAAASPDNVAQLLDALQASREALEFYSNESGMRSLVMGGIVNEKYFERAREALRSVFGEEGK